MRKTCFGCGCSYEATRSDQLYCCPACRRRRNNKYTELIIHIEKKWFNMILSGEKTEEYRERKPYWEGRFKRYFGWGYGPISKDKKEWGWRFHPNLKKTIIFRNGYGRNVPQFRAECSISEKTGNPEWGAEEGVVYYTLHIHRVFALENCEMPEKSQESCPYLEHDERTDEYICHNCGFSEDTECPVPDPSGCPAETNIHGNTLHPSISES